MNIALKQTITSSNELVKNRGLQLRSNVALGEFSLENRRYIGSKSKLIDWLSKLIDEHASGDSFFDVFAGTGVVSKAMLGKFHRIIINDFLYFDPPYLITFSEYNKLWNETDEVCLYKLLDKLTQNGVRWGLSNMYSHKGKTNEMLGEFGKKYHSFAIKSNYISYIDNTIKQDSKEVYITNYAKKDCNE